MHPAPRCTAPGAQFLARVDPGAAITVYADGTLPDGEEFVMYLDPADSHGQYAQDSFQQFAPPPPSSGS